MKEIELKMRHYDQVLLQIQSISTSQHIRIATLERLPRIDPTSEINQLRGRQLFIEKPIQQHGKQLEGINENDAKYRQLKNKILSMDVFHSNLSLRMDNLDLFVHHALKKPEPEVTTPETLPPPAKISKPDTAPIIKLDKIVWMRQRGTVQQAFDDIFNQMIIIRRVAVANMQGVLRNVLGKEIMEKLLDTGLEKVINMYEHSPEKFLKMHTLNSIYWFHSYQVLEQKKNKHKDNPEKLKEIDIRIVKTGDTPKPPLEYPEEGGEEGSKDGSCSGFFAWLACTLEDIAETLAGFVAGVVTGLKPTINLPDPGLPSLRNS